MALLIKAEDLDGYVSAKAAIEATEEGFKSLARWPDFAHPRQRVVAEHRHLTMHYAGIPDLAVAGVFAHFAHKSYADDVQVHLTTPRRVYVAWDSEEAELLAIIVGSLPLFAVDRAGIDFGSETAVTSAVGTHHLAREDSRVLGLFGTGRLARRTMLAMSLIRPIEEVRVYSRKEDHRNGFCDEMQGHTEAALHPVDHPRAVVEGADIVACATNANAPVFDGSWLDRGQHVSSVVGSNKELVQQGLLPRGRREVDDTTIKRADVVAATSVKQAIQDEQACLMESVDGGFITWEEVHSLADVVAGNTPGRSSADQITMFHQNSDQGAGYMGLARYVYELARREGLGTEI